MHTEDWRYNPDQEFRRIEFLADPLGYSLGILNRIPVEKRDSQFLSGVEVLKETAAQFLN